MRKYSGTFAVYKKIGAAKFSLIAPRENDMGHITKNGAVFLEAAPGAGEEWDWDKKIGFAIGITDICQILENPDVPPKLLHSAQNAGSKESTGPTKTLAFEPGAGKYEGTYMMKLFQKESSGETRSVTVPFSHGEFTLLLRLLMSAAPLLLAWD